MPRAVRLLRFPAGELLCYVWIRGGNFPEKIISMSIEIFANNTTGDVDMSVSVVFQLEKDYHFCVGHHVWATSVFKFGIINQMMI